MREVISHLKSITTANSPNGSLVHHPPMRVADKEVQTDFPVALLENYVVNNRKRILKLLGYSNAAAQNSPSSDHPLRSSWNPLPNRYVHYFKIEKKVKVGNTVKHIFQLRDAILIDLQLNMISGRLPPIPSQRSEKKLTKPVQKQPLEVP